MYRDDWGCLAICNEIKRYLGRPAISFQDVNLTSTWREVFPSAVEEEPSWRPDQRWTTSVRVHHHCPSISSNSVSDAILEQHIPADQLGEVKRVLYGSNMGKAVERVEISADLESVASKGNFEIKHYKMGALAEQLRSPRVVRVGLIQNAIVKPTTASVKEQVYLRYQSEERHESFAFEGDADTYVLWYRSDGE